MRRDELFRPRSGTLLERTLAYLIDSLVTLLLWGLIVAALTGGSLDRFAQDAPLQLIAGFLFLLVPFVYFVLTEGTLGTTLGKRVVGLRVLGPEDAPAGLFAATVRNVLRLAWALGPVGPLFLALDVVLVQLSERDHRVGDRAAGTRVVRQGPALLPMG